MTTATPWCVDTLTGRSTPRTVHRTGCRPYDGRVVPLHNFADASEERIRAYVAQLDLLRLCPVCLPEPGAETELPAIPTVIVDIDGTLALRDGRGPFDWHRVGEDQPNYPVIAAVTALAATGCPVVLVTGRMEQCRDLTVTWLATHLPDVEYAALHMRPDDDYRKDVELKREIYTEHLAGTDVLCVWDDRDAVVAMWRDLGLACFQVAPGTF